MTAQTRFPFSPVARRDLPPLKVTVAPNGARRGPADHPQLPVTTEEIATTAAACHRAGADEIHLHVRDSTGHHTLDPGRYAQAIAAIAETAPGMTVQITTESAGRFDVATQLATLCDLRPAAASISVREAQRDPALAPHLYAAAAEASTRVQHILYDARDLATLRRLLADGTIPDHMRDVILVLGSYDPPRPAQPSELPPWLAALAGDFPNWTICAFGRHEHATARAAIAAGGHIRIGFENNLHRPDGSLATDNAENVTRAVAAARALGRPLLSEVTA